MISFFKSYEEGKGYIVNIMDTDSVPCVQKVRCFGDRQSDAIEFCRDCTEGVIIPLTRARFFAKTYTSQKYIYLGRGRLQKQRT